MTSRFWQQPEDDEDSEDDELYESDDEKPRNEPQPAARAWDDDDEQEDVHKVVPGRQKKMNLMNEKIAKVRTLLKSSTVVWDELTKEWESLNSIIFQKANDLVKEQGIPQAYICLLYTSPSPRDS
eukprot:TRINITY_DN5077_c0_g1_i5.p1 TRINITY_DN5077_c0_g1~~TRINITY_DN5077_c0_g1_i5.p1  ORF type:complete len:125 (-),score=26.84 TRINITY_DN5077_c0_g1_i5:4-378(-)